MNVCRLLQRIAAALVIALMFGVFAGRAWCQGDRPNILFIMSDDHAAQAVGAYGGILATVNPTPNIDRLADEGVRLTHAFVTNSICTPARATLLTGQYSHRNGIRVLAQPLPPERQTLALEMRKAGYETAMVGKWHLGTEPAFDYYCVLPGQGSYFNPIMRDKSKGDWPDNTRRFSGYNSTHCTDAVTEVTLDWLKNREHKDKPFFLMHHFKAPHDNFENAERYDFLYDDIFIPEPESLWRRGNHGPLNHPRYGTSIGKRTTWRNMGMHMFVDPDLPPDTYKREAYQRYLKKYLRCVKGVDDAVGKIIDYLRSTGELDNTIILYTSDQGFMLGEHDYIDKRWMYEESMRVPFIVRFPKWIKAGTTVDAMINNTDFAPTILAMAGVDTAASMQGRSFLPMLRGQPQPADWRTATYYRYWMHMAHHGNPAHYGIRTLDYKLIFFYGLPLDAPRAVQKPTDPYWELYDLRKDPHEMNNVYADPAYASIVRQLKDQLVALKKEVGDTDEQYPELQARLAQDP